MSQRIRSHLVLFKIISQADKKLIKALFKFLDKDFVEALSECCYNFLKGNIKVSTISLRKLNNHKTSIRELGDKKKSIKSKKEVISQKGHLFLPTFFKFVTKAIITYCRK